MNNLQPRLQRLNTLPDAATVSVLRLDELDPYVTGNKSFKLKYNLLKLQAEGHGRLLTFGGAYSNHLVAVAAAGQRLGIETIGVVRGEVTEPLNPRLRFAVWHAPACNVPSGLSTQGIRTDPVCSARNLW